MRRQGFIRNGLTLAIALASLLLLFTLLGVAPHRSVAAAPTATFTVNSTSDAIDASPGDGVCQTSTVGQCTLRAAIMEANALPGADTIVVPAGTYNLLRPGNDDTAVNGDLDITSTLTISGAGYANTIIDGVGFMSPDRIFHITGTVDVAIKGVTIMRGRPQQSNLNGDGGGLYNYNGRLTLSGVRVYTNTASGSGGGLISLGETHAITLDNSVLEDNVGIIGGGLYVDSASVTLLGSQIVSNTALGAFLASAIGGGGYIANQEPDKVVNISGSMVGYNRAMDGGGMYVYAANAQIDHSLFISNTASAGLYSGNAGGLVVLYHAPAPGGYTITDSTFISNTAANSGGGLYASTVLTLTLTNVTFTRNQAASGGGLILDSGKAVGTNVSVTHNLAAYAGGLYLSNAQANFTRSTIANNHAQDSVGGGGYIGSNSVLTLTTSVIQSNAAGQSGGGLHIESGRAYLSDTQVLTNSASHGGGLYVQGSAVLTLTHSTVGGNASLKLGGGLYLNGAAALISASTIRDNLAYDNGGGLYLQNSPANVVNSTISQNWVEGLGGGVYQGGGQSAFIEQSTIADNRAADISFFNAEGGGVYVVPTGTLGLRHTLVANNTSTGISQDCAGPITSQDYNFIEVTTGCNLSGITTHNVTGVDAKLGKLADNGGDTLTHALLAGSPARDQIPANLCPAIDQRGKARPAGAACDIGAVEAYFTVFTPLAVR